MTDITLFGIRSPLVVEYEETCRRLGVTVAAAVDAGGTPRLHRDAPVVAVDAVRPGGAPFLACAFTPKRRAELWRMAEAAGLEPAEALIDPTAVTARSVRVGEGSFLNAGVIVGAVTMIGRNVLVNRAASLGHHVVVGDDVSIGPGATLAGNIQVGAGAMIGVGAVVLPDIRIGAGAVVAGGSLVRRHVPDGAFVAGSPAVERPFDPARSSLHVEEGE